MTLPDFTSPDVKRLMSDMKHEPFSAKVIMLFFLVLWKHFHVKVLSFSRGGKTWSVWTLMIVSFDLCVYAVVCGCVGKRASSFCSNFLFFLMQVLCKYKLQVNFQTSLCLMYVCQFGSFLAVLWWTGPGLNGPKGSYKGPDAPSQLLLQWHSFQMTMGWNFWLSLRCFLTIYLNFLEVFCLYVLIKKVQSKMTLKEMRQDCTF